MSKVVIQDEKGKTLGTIDKAYFVRFINPRKTYPVKYLAAHQNPNGTQNVSGSFELKGEDLTENQIFELFLNGYDFPSADPTTTENPIIELKTPAKQNPEPGSEKSLKKVAEALWSLLDDIDTLSDICKPTLGNPKAAMAFYHNAMRYASQRFKYLQSDGYNIYTNEEFENRPAPDDNSILITKNTHHGPTGTITWQAPLGSSTVTLHDTTLQSKSPIKEIVHRVVDGDSVAFCGKNPAYIDIDHNKHVFSLDIQQVTCADCLQTINNKAFDHVQKYNKG